ncbi:24818_t:CDS:2 [Gigaspora margarita]|uniref:24818_t:CDS:1 n=1 Tax=Gigaspora margarita TaxID=4874 RepID=A0ABM8VZF3_GIGMA|nr:24818_t:CDS:2 [Gigaspora margarita]
MDLFNRFNSESDTGSKIRSDWIHNLISPYGHNLNQENLVSSKTVYKDKLVIMSEKTDLEN